MTEQALSKEKFYELIGRRGDDFSMERRQQDVLYDVKWKKFLRRVKLFRFIPFIDFVFASGSMALGSVRDTSDFDLIVGARSGRIFTVRFFTLTLFGFTRLRRKKNASKGEGKDKFCFNQFVTKNVFPLQSHDIYSRYLYEILVPVFGDPVLINELLVQQDEQKRFLTDDLRYYRTRTSLLRRILERGLGSKIGNGFEGFLKFFQVKKIEHGLRKTHLGHKPRIVYTDDLLEFHHDTHRIERMGKNL